MGKRIPKTVYREVYNTLLELEKSHKYPEDSILPQFDQEIRNLGFEFQIGNQVETICRKNPELTRPIVIKYYSLSKHDNETAFLVGCLLSKENKHFNEFFLKEFQRKEYNKKYNDVAIAIGNFLILNADIKYKQEYIDIIKNGIIDYGKSYIIEICGNLKINESIPYLLEVIDEENMCGFVLDALNKFKDPNLLPIFKKYENDKNTRYRNAAKKGIKTIEKVLEKQNKN